MKILPGALCVALLWLPGAYAAVETVYVQAPPSVALLSTTAADAPVVSRLAAGAPLTVLGRQTGYVNVQTADGVRGWLRETDLTTVAPPSARVTELEQENVQLRRDLAAARDELAAAQARLRQAQQAVSNARESGADAAAGLEAERDRLRAELAASTRETDGLRQRVAELEMSQEAARLLSARQPKETAANDRRLSKEQWLMLAGGGLLLLLTGAWLGTAGARRKLRQRYHGLEL